jgi:short-subunit dehydrogenase
MKSFRGKVAAITGAGSGIGRALAGALAAEGCHLALSDIDPEGLAATAAGLRDKGVRITTQTVDVAERAVVHAWAEQVAKDHGHVNLIFNNAGVALGSTVAGTSYEDFEWLMGINFWGVVYGTKAFLPLLEQSGEGHIVNISSIFGILGVPTQSTYNAAKFAVRGFTESLRQELDIAKSCVSATCVHPGGIKTNIAKKARVGDDVKGTYIEDGDAGRQMLDQLFITSPESAAKTILGAVRRNQRRVLVGPDAVAVELMVRLLPAGYQRILGTIVGRTTRAAQKKAAKPAAT